jgi:hypothetical protein
MKLTDQEQVILKVIGSSVAEISRVIRAVGYPKATVKQVLVRLNEKGIVALHRHDYPRSLAPAERKLMIRIGSDYFNAVSMRKRNPEKKSKSKTVLKKTGRALKGFAQGALSAASQIFGAGAEALNPVRRKVRNKYIDLVIKGQAKKTPQGWKVGSKTFAQGRGTVNVSSGYYLDRSTGLVYAKRERNAAKKRVKRNAARTVSAAKTAKRRARASSQTGRKKATAKVRSVAKARKAPTRRASVNPTRKGMRKGYREAKRLSKITQGRYFSSESGQRKASRHEKRHARKGKSNPTPAVLAVVNPKSKAAQNRKEFAGEYRKDLPLRYPEGTPQGLSKLGKLLKIKTDRAVITPINNQTWLVRDLKGKLHIGTTSKDGLIWSGPAEDFGHVRRIEYEDVKKHLGYDHPQGFYHFMGEEDGIRPKLYADGRGGLKFKGGHYRITPEGIVT